MGRTTVEAFVADEFRVGRFDFLVDTGSRFVGLPIDDIEALGLYKIPGGRVQADYWLGRDGKRYFFSDGANQGGSRPALV